MSTIKWHIDSIKMVKEWISYDFFKTVAQIWKLFGQIVLKNLKTYFLNFLGAGLFLKCVLMRLKNILALVL